MYEIIKEFGGVASLIIAISSAISLFISKILLGKSEAKNQRKLKRLENFFQNEITRMKQYNEISKETYQKLFDKKIEVYQNLYEIILSYKSTISEQYAIYYAPGGGYNLHNEGFLKISKEIKDLIINNPLVISDELSKAYKIIYEKQANFFLLLNSSSEENPQNIDELQGQLKKETEKDILNLSSLVEIDISNIRKYLKGY